MQEVKLVKDSNGRAVKLSIDKPVPHMQDVADMRIVPFGSGSTI